MTQASYIEKVLKRFKIENSKRGFLPLRHRVKLSKTQSPKIDEEIRKMCEIPYTSAVAWKSSKQDTIADSTTEVEYIAASKAAKETVWIKNHIQELGVVPSIVEPIVIFCDNDGAIAHVKEPISHHKSKHIFRHYHLLREMVGRGDVRLDCVASLENTADSLQARLTDCPYSASGQDRTETNG
ncbi:UNVERIFIED_CONTAM: Copia protein [Sesamum radiatum]|uniref:Copia protein n=1 Tax=Sesamum radiatum TaxID=300843 RepID=A0AAW2KUC2_SESRA